MTSTPVKEVGSFFVNSSKAQGSGVSVSGDFGAIWNAQTSKGAQSDVGSKAEPKKAEDMQKEPEEEVTLKLDKTGGVREESRVKGADKETVSEKSEELTEEDLEAAMEVLGTVAAELMQKIADVFGISMEELQAAMDAMGMEQTDVLDASMLSGLLLQLGGAADSYALVTDEALYNNYRMLMEQMSNALTECAEEFGMNAEQLNALLQQLDEQSGLPGNVVADTQLVQAVEDVVNAEIEVQPNGDSVNEVLQEETSQQITGVASANRENNAGAQSGEGGRTEESSEESAAQRGTEFTLQSTNSEGFSNQVQQLSSTYVESPWDTQTLDIMRQIMDHMKLQVTAETQTLEMQLHPASLGTVQVNLAAKGGVITASFITENEAVKAALESQMLQLKESFAEQGVKVEAIEVTVQTHEFERNLEQGRGRNNEQETPRRSRTRRINLEDALSMSDMEEEDAIAAEMMVASGSTVDYTV